MMAAWPTKQNVAKDTMKNSLRTISTMLLLVLGARDSCSAPTPTPVATAKGLVIYISGASASDEFASAVEFTKAETIGMTSTFTFADGKTVKMAPNNLKRIFMYPDFATMTLVTEKDW